MRFARTVIVQDPFARANLREALAGPGAPAGVIACTEAGATIEVTFDAARTAPELIEALIAVETVFVPARAPAIDDFASAAAVAARGLGEPALDAACIIESYLS